MKNYDKNSLTGFVLMFLILLIFNFYFLPTNEEISEQKEDVKTENNISEPKSINTDKIKSNAKLRILTFRTTIEELSTNHA